MSSKLFRLPFLFIIILFSSRISDGQQFSNAVCTGAVCALRGGEAFDIECLPDPGGLATPAPTTITSQYTDNIINPTIIDAWISAAINPTTGVIYVMYTVSPNRYIGTISDPNIAAPVTEIQRIGGPLTNAYFSMTFNCDGNLYGINSASSDITQIDIGTGTETGFTIAQSNSCGEIGTECDELITMDYDTFELDRLSTDAGATPQNYYVGNFLTGADSSPALIDYNGLCQTDTPDDDQMTAAAHIGNDIIMIKCNSDARLFILDTSGATPTIQQINDGTTEAITGEVTVHGLINYLPNGDLCVPNCIAPDDDDSDSESSDSDSDSESSESSESTDSDSDSDSDSDDEDGALIADNQAIPDSAREYNNAMPSTMTVKFTDTAIFTFWAVITIFAVVNILIWYFCIKQKYAHKERILEHEPHAPKIDL